MPSTTVSEQIDVMSQEPSAPKMSLSILAVEPLAKWSSEGHRLDQCTAELAWWVEGTDWEQREILLTGIVARPKYGGQGEPLTFTIEPESP